MRKIFAILLAVIFFGFSTPPEEGMWLLTQLEQLNLHQKGLKLEVDQIYHPDRPSITDAIVWLGGCTASFVSPDGLMLTNHHCAYGALQRASSKEHDYLTGGFLAKDRSEELRAVGTTASVLIKMKDVTGEVLDAAKNITDPLARDKTINARIAEMTDKEAGGRDDVFANIAAMYKGKQYVLFVYKRYRDVRVVYAPPNAIGQYGGDTDNWMWPRHSGDFTFLRAYSAPDGSGAEYSPNNVPVKPKNYLRIATTDLKEGDFTFILGFPGATTRWRTSNSVRWNLKYNYPETVKLFQNYIDMLDDVTKDDPDGRIKVAGLRSGLANTLKNYQGKIDGMTKTHFLQKKIDFEKELMAFIDRDEKLRAQYGDILPRIEKLYAQLEKTKTKDDVLRWRGLSGTLATLASQIYGVAKEREKPEKERTPGFSEKSVERTIKSLPVRFLSYYEPADRAMLTYWLKSAAALPADQRLQGLENIFAGNGGDPAKFVANAYENSRLADVEFAKSQFQKSSQELKALNDPFLNMAAALYDETEAYQQRNQTFGAKITNLRKEYLNALYAWKGQGLYPDANSTMRFTYGNIAGYHPADAIWYSPFTTLRGVIEKNTGTAPFNMPAKLGELEAKKEFGRWVDPELNDVPVGFTHRCDITGGNSGSPVMNARGELIGLAFDGNYEAMTGDWQYDYNMQRTISVDIRYVMFITEKFAGAGYLLREMGIQPVQ